MNAQSTFIALQRSMYCESAISYSLSSHRSRRLRSRLSVGLGQVATILHLACTSVVSTPAISIAESESNDAQIQWKELEPGLSFGRYSVPLESAALTSEVLLLKVNLEKFDVHAVPASSVGSPNTDVETITKRFGGIAGINANFFDPEGHALGLVVSKCQETQRLQLGGNVLTGIFLIENKTPKILHRDNYQSAKPCVAVQSGPRLIASRERLSVLNPDVTSRRSGIAVTGKNEVIIYATVLRFPGASMKQIQDMLLLPSLDIVDALNLDGGGSSQFYIGKSAPDATDTFVTGGDVVPVALVVKHANT